MLLAIDVGNTQIKTAVFELNTIIQKDFLQLDNWKKELLNLLTKFDKVQVIIIASVGKIQKEDLIDVAKNIKLVFITKEFHFPFNNLYKTPLTLGIDRMVLTAGATLYFPKKNCLIIDVGTCITYDFIDENSNYLGGAISPGIRLRYESLHNYTTKLPLLAKSQPENFIGNSTKNSIHSGVVNGVVHEIEGFINTYSNNYKNFIIILTGGDTEFLAKRFKNTIFANSNFLLESLNQIYLYNQND
jgi:type III pantothenate kinase